MANAKDLRKPKTMATEEIKEKIVRDNHDKKLTTVEIQRKYNVSFRFVKKILENNEYGFWLNPPALAPGVKSHPVTNKRIGLTTEDRNQAISNDALEIIELSLQNMKELLKGGLCSATQIKDFVNSVIPYVIKKPETGTKKDDKAESKGNIVDMWRKQEEIKQQNGK